MHHNRLTPCYNNDTKNPSKRESTIMLNSPLVTSDASEEEDEDNSNPAIELDAEADEDADEDAEAEPVDNSIRRYPSRARKARQIPGAIPWTAVPDDALS